MQMDTIGIVLHCLIMIGLVVAVWLMLRIFNPPGLLGHPLLTLIGWFVMGFIALAFGVWDQYDDGLDVIGMAIQAFLFDGLRLPVSIKAVYKLGKQNQIQGQSGIDH